MRAPGAENLSMGLIAAPVNVEPDRSQRRRAPLTIVPFKSSQNTGVATREDRDTLRDFARLSPRVKRIVRSLISQLASSIVIVLRALLT